MTKFITLIYVDICRTLVRLSMHPLWVQIIVIVMTI